MSITVEPRNATSFDLKIVGNVSPYLKKNFAKGYLVREKGIKPDQIKIARYLRQKEVIVVLKDGSYYSFHVKRVFEDIKATQEE